MYRVELFGGSPWGFRLEDAAEIPGVAGRKVQVAKLNTNSKAQSQGIQIGDVVQSVNGRTVVGMSSSEVMQIVRSANDSLSLELIRNHTTSADDISSSGFSSMDNNSVVSSSSFPITSATKNHRNLMLDQFSNGDDKIDELSTFGERKVKSYRPVSFDVSSGERSTSNPPKVSAAFDLNSDIESANSQSVRNTSTSYNKNLNENSSSSVKVQDSEMDLNRWKSDKENSWNSFGSVTTQASYSAESGSFPDAAGISRSSNLISPQSDNLLSGSISSNLSRLPVAQNPTITLLKKKRAQEQIPRYTEDETSDGEMSNTRIFTKQQYNSSDSKKKKVPTATLR